MGGDPAPTEETGLGGDERAGADRGHPPAGGCDRRDPRDEPRVVTSRAGPVAARNDQGVDWLVGVGERSGAQGDPALGLDRLPVRRGEGHAVRLVQAEGAGRPGRPGEDLDRTHRIEGLHSGEGDDDHVARAHDAILRQRADGVNAILPTIQAIRGLQRLRHCREDRAATSGPAGSAGAPGAHPGQEVALPLVRPGDGAGEDVLAIGRDLLGYLGPQHVTDGRRTEVFDEDGGDDARMVVIVGGGRDRGAGDGVEDGAMHGPVGIGVMAVGLQRGHGVAGTEALDPDPQSAANSSFLGPDAVTPSGREDGPAWVPPWPATACGSPGSAD